MSTSKFDGWTQQQIRDYFDEQERASRQAFAGQPLPRISRVKRDDYPHWKVVAYEFHTTDGKRVLVDRGEGEQVEGVLRGVRPARHGQDAVVVEVADRNWACVRADGSDWDPKDNGRVRVESLTVPVVARPLDGERGETQEWTLQTNMEGQP